MRAGARLWWGLPVLVALLWAAGALTVQTIPGLPTPPEFVVTSLPFVRFLRDIASFLAIGALLVGGLLLPDRRFRGWAVGWAIAWLSASALLGVLTISEVRAAGISEAFDSIGPFLADSVIGRVLLAQLAAAAAVAMIAWATGSRRWMWAALAIAVAGAAATGLLGHGGLGGGHEAASVSLMLHIASISLWVGGLAMVVAAAMARPDATPGLVSTFSVVALWCVIVAAETGLLNASMRVATASALVGTWYGSLVLGKAVLLGWLVLLGWHQRRKVVGRLDGNAPARLLLTKFAGWELVLMGTAIAVSVTLARIGPATAVAGAYSPVALALVTVLGPALISAAWTPRGRLADWLRGYPEVPSLLLAIGIVEVAGVGLTAKLLGTELGTAIGTLLLLALGWAWSIAARGRRGSTALVISMAAWPLAVWAAGRLSGIDTGVRAFVLGVVLVEALLFALLVLRIRAARRSAPAAEAAMAG